MLYLEIMYTIHTTPGFIIGSRPSGEAGKLLSIFTQDLGLIRATAQGIRFEKSKLRPFIQDYSVGIFSFVRGKEFWRLTSAQEQKIQDSKFKIEEKAAPIPIYHLVIPTPTAVIPMKIGIPNELGTDVGEDKSFFRKEQQDSRFHGNDKVVNRNDNNEGRNDTKDRDDDINSNTSDKILDSYGSLNSFDGLNRSSFEMGSKNDSVSLKTHIILKKNDREVQELTARIALLLSRLLQGEDPHPELFATLNALFDFITLYQKKSSLDIHMFDAEIWKTLESLMVIRILHRLGYVALIPELKSDIESDSFDVLRLKELQPLRTSMNLHINKALRESHL
jgi:recombinational DNA repair protein (RecF pathway)